VPPSRRIGLPEPFGLLRPTVGNQHWVTSLEVIGILCLIFAPGWLAISWIFTQLENQPNVGPGRIGTEEYKAGAERNDQNQRHTAAMIRKSRVLVCSTLVIVGIALVAIGAAS
jgi:hypothetical protein